MVSIILLICSCEFGFENQEILKTYDIVEDVDFKTLPKFDHDENLKFIDYLSESAINLDNQSNKRPQWLQNIIDWVKDHTGPRMFDNCTGDNACGPCPGLCLFARRTLGEKHTNSDNIDPDEFKQGVRSYGITIITNEMDGEEYLIWTTKYGDEIIYNNKLYLVDDYYLNANATASLGKSQILVEKGAYKVFDIPKSDYVFTILNSTMK